MGFAVQLYFDKMLEDALYRVRAGLTAAGVTPTLERLGDRPHISLSVLDSLESERFLPALKGYARSQHRFPIDILGFDSFSGEPGFVYLSPRESSALRRYQRLLHDLVASIDAAVHEHYLPANWVPHSTVGFELPLREVRVALDWLRDHFKPLSGTCTRVGLIEFRPVKEIATYPLAG
jgi:2'-5' RNA ligase